MQLSTGTTAIAPFGGHHPGRFQRTAVLFPNSPQFITRRYFSTLAKLKHVVPLGYITVYSLKRKHREREKKESDRYKNFISHPITLKPKRKQKPIATADERSEVCLYCAIPLLLPTAFYFFYCWPSIVPWSEPSEQWPLFTQ